MKAAVSCAEWGPVLCWCCFWHAVTCMLAVSRIGAQMHALLQNLLSSHTCKDAP